MSKKIDVFGLEDLEKINKILKLMEEYTSEDYIDLALEISSDGKANLVEAGTSSIPEEFDTDMTLEEVIKGLNKNTRKHKLQEELEDLDLDDLSEEDLDALDKILHKKK